MDDTFTDHEKVISISSRGGVIAKSNASTFKNIISELKNENITKPSITKRSYIFETELIEEFEKIVSYHNLKKNKLMVKILTEFVKEHKI